MIETDAVTLQDYLRVVRRRKWMVVQAALLLTLAAVAFSLHQQALYEASADLASPLGSRAIVIVK